MLMLILLPRRDVVRGLHYLHGHGFLHKDIKTQVSQGILRESRSSCASSVHLVPKGYDDSGHPKFRVTNDLPEVNDATVPMPLGGK